jgi:hypothetical protein
MEEGVHDRVGLREQQRPLAEVVEDERGKDDREPGDADRAGAEVSHVGVERLPAGHDQEDGAEDEEPERAVADEQIDAPARVERGEDRRRADDSRDAEHREGREPRERERAEQPSDAARAAVLQEEQAAQDRDRDRDHPGGERRRLQLEPLDRAQDGDRGRDDAVAVEEGGADDPDRRQDRAASLAGRTAGDEREEGEDAALAPVVRLHDDAQVLDRDDHDQRPHHEGEHAEHGGGRDGERVRRLEAGADGVERARADVPVDDAEGGEREAGEVAAARRPLRRRPAGEGLLVVRLVGVGSRPVRLHLHRGRL